MSVNATRGRKMCPTRADNLPWVMAMVSIGAQAHKTATHMRSNTLRAKAPAANHAVNPANGTPKRKATLATEDTLTPNGASITVANTAITAINGCWGWAAPAPLGSHAEESRAHNCWKLSSNPPKAPPYRVGKEKAEPAKTWGPITAPTAPNPLTVKTEPKRRR